MGFGTELQSRSSHEALLHLQETEIKLLENVKKSVSMRIQADRDCEYFHDLEIKIINFCKL